MFDRDDALDLIEYDRWANHSCAAQLAPLAAPPADAVKVWAHVVGASELWLARVRGEDAQKHAVWPAWSLAEATQRFERVGERWREQLSSADAAELARVVTFHNSRGEPCADRLDDIVRHLMNHGTHHRAQIAGELRRAGVVPATLDFIVWRRKGSPRVDDGRGEGSHGGESKTGGARASSAAASSVAERTRRTRHFVIESTYLAPLAQIDAHLAAHRAHLETGFQSGMFLASGPQEPRTGGMILARAADRVEIESFLARDPFAQRGLSRYRVVEFLPVKQQPSMRAWWGGS